MLNDCLWFGRAQINTYTCTRSVLSPYLYILLGQIQGCFHPLRKKLKHFCHKADRKLYLHNLNAQYAGKHEATTAGWVTIIHKS